MLQSRATVIQSLPPFRFHGFYETSISFRLTFFRANARVKKIPSFVVSNQFEFIRDPPLIIIQYDRIDRIEHKIRRRTKRRGTVYFPFFFPHIASILDTRYRESNTRERKKSGSNVGWRETLDPSRGRRRFGKLEKDYPSREMIRYDSRITARFERMKERGGLNWGPFVDSRSTLARSNNT